MENEKKSLAKDGEGKNIKIYVQKISLVFSVRENKLYFEFIYFKLRVFFFCKTFRICGNFFIINIFFLAMMNFPRENISKELLIHSFDNQHKLDLSRKIKFIEGNSGFYYPYDNGYF